MGLEHSFGIHSSGAIPRKATGMVAMYDVDVHVEPVHMNLVAQLAELQTRLARGYEMIDEHREAGLPVAPL